MRNVMVAVLVAGVAAGCSGPGPEKFHPSETDARKALEVALTAWKNGGKPEEKLTTGKVGVTVVDATWSAGQKLTGYEIVAEEDGNGPRFFTVKLTLPKGPQTVKYVVIGNDPLWVYTEAAFNKLSGS